MRFIEGVACSTCDPNDLVPTGRALSSGLSDLERFDHEDKQ